MAEMLWRTSFSPGVNHVIGPGRSGGAEQSMPLGVEIDPLRGPGVRSVPGYSALMARDEATATAHPGTWRELAVARSLDPARSRAEKRVQRFLDAALELMNSESAKDFTVQQVVERSGQSLRSFYQYFAAKHELLLALFEELLDEAEKAGAIRRRLPHRRIAGVLIQAISFNAFAATISGSSVRDRGGDE